MITIPITFFFDTDIIGFFFFLLCFNIIFKVLEVLVNAIKTRKQYKHWKITDKPML